MDADNKINENDMLYNLAIFYDVESETNPRFKKKSIRLFKRLARAGHVDSQYILALIYGVGDGVRRSERRSVYWNKRAAMQGHARAQYSYGAVLMRREATRAEGLEWIKKAAQEDEEAILYLGFAYEWGIGIERDIAKAVELYRYLADRKNVDGYYYLGLFYEFEEKDFKQAEFYFRLAIEQGDLRAALQLERLNLAEE